MMRGVDEKIAHYYRLNPTQFTFLWSLTIRQGFDAHGVMKQSLSIELRTSHEDETACLVLDFIGVRRLEVRQPQLSQISLSHLEVLRADCLPNPEGRFLVRDPEQERIIWFECEDFDAVVQ